ncbi:ubiA prenyltransferase domain-containing protein 1 homolog [Onthophagus taurus]|uniref:ubiA prenyltransferase domain-containing protein 1 homolog n=1 Tax=Onthophagus taurus TaxID=166361 RepID=UPI0039BDD0A1
MTEKQELLNGNLTKKSNSRSGLMKISSYILALRPWSWSGSLMPTLLGSTLAYKNLNDTTDGTDFNYITLLLTLFTVVCVHGAGNLVNTYFDFIKGIDTRKSDDRILVDHILTKDEVVSLGALLYFFGCIGFILLAALSPAKMEHLALVYFGGLSSSFLYTGGIGLKYIALGDVIVLTIFGPVAVLFAFMSQTGRLEWATIYYAIPLALNTEAILHSNNTRDSEHDKRAGIVTLAILIGHTASHVLYAFLLFIPYIMFVVASMKYSKWFVLPLVTLPNAFKIEKQFRSNDIDFVPRRTAKLNLYFGLLFVIACCFIEDLPFITKR